MITEDRIEHIKEWIADYALNIEKQPISLVVGISGGIDSAVTSTLCARTNLNTIVVSMPIKQNKNHFSQSSSTDVLGNCVFLICYRFLNFTIIKRKFPDHR